MQLSRFFTLAEMTRSDTAMRLGISNLPDETATENLKALCTAVLDPLRDAVASSITVSSGYRGPELNARIGGAKKSQHVEGKAADIQSSHITVLELFKTVIRMQLPYDQIIFEAKNRNTKWVHVSHDPARARGAILVAQFSDAGAVSYRTISMQEALDLADPIPPTRSGEPLVLAFEELADEPDFDDEPRMAGPRKKAAKRKATSRRKPKAKASPKRKAPPKRKAAAARRKRPAKRVRMKAKKHR